MLYCLAQQIFGFCNLARYLLILSFIPGILSVLVSLMGQRAEVEYTSSITNPQSIADFIYDMGFDVDILEETKGGEETLHLLVSLVKQLAIN